MAADAALRRQRPGARSAREGARSRHGLGSTASARHSSCRNHRLHSRSNLTTRCAPTLPVAAHPSFLAATAPSRRPLHPAPALALNPPSSAASPPIMSAKMQQGQQRPGGSRFAQFKLVLLGASAPSTPSLASAPANTRRRIGRRKGICRPSGSRHRS